MLNQKITGVVQRAAQGGVSMAWFPQTDIEHAMQHEIDTLRAENERLREALEKIVEHEDNLYSGRIARAALRSSRGE
jgi:hypothetical protein